MHEDFLSYYSSCSYLFANLTHVAIFLSRSHVSLLVTLKTDDLGYHGGCSYIFADIVLVNKCLFKFNNRNKRMRSIDVVLFDLMTPNGYLITRMVLAIILLELLVNCKRSITVILL